jgi:hypothetical protein
LEAEAIATGSFRKVPGRHNSTNHRARRLGFDGCHSLSQRNERIATHGPDPITDGATRGRRASVLESHGELSSGGKSITRIMLERFENDAIEFC